MLRLINTKDALTNQYGFDQMRFTRQVPVASRLFVGAGHIHRLPREKPFPAGTALFGHTAKSPHQLVPKAARKRLHYIQIEAARTPQRRRVLRDSVSWVQRGSLTDPPCVGKDARGARLEFVRSFFLFLSRQKQLRRWMETSSAAKRLATRFVAGETLDQALAVSRRLNDRRHHRYA